MVTPLLTSRGRMMPFEWLQVKQTTSPTRGGFDNKGVRVAKTASPGRTESSASESENSYLESKSLSGIVSELVRRALPVALHSNGAKWRRLSTYVSGDRLSKLQAALKTSKAVIVCVRSTLGNVFGALLVCDDEGWSRDSLLWELDGDSLQVHRWAGGNPKPVIVHSGPRHWAVGHDPSFGLKLVGPVIAQGFSNACATFGNPEALCGQAEFSVSVIEVWALQNCSGLALLSPQTFAFAKSLFDTDDEDMDLPIAPHKLELPLASRQRCLSTLD